MLELFCCAIRDVDAGRLSQYRDLLSTDECERLVSFRRDSAAQTFLISRALLRTVLAEKIGGDPQSLHFVRDANDKPQLVGHPLHFNVSHSEEWVALAVSDAPVGVDIETSARTNNILGIAQRFFQPGEFEWLQTLSEAERAEKFCELWAIKEACVKWSGLGIGRAIAGVGVALDGGRITLQLRADMAAFGSPQAVLFAPAPTMRLAAVGEGLIDKARVGDAVVQWRVPLGITEMLPLQPLASFMN